MGWKWSEWPSSWFPSEVDLFWFGVSPSAAGYLVLSSPLSSPPSSPYSPPFSPASSSPSLSLSRLLRGYPPPRFLHLVVELDLVRGQPGRIFLEEGLSDLREGGHSGCGELRLRENVVFVMKVMSLRTSMKGGKKRSLGKKDILKYSNRS
ncbi:hypothetical protein NA56DRAFT_642390 [Hyaloscypha hepaticicola]|uniref:Uncharacterized protein n=1 Tax=Hyaloscypha hepaticicola TaxID=2082293 RepID=A0A2J6QGH4_9HELO|nr:hypothetical protein NA56DRAFT_642390 [Hyaloscypha hepaticicola]